MPEFSLGIQRCVSDGVDFVGARFTVKLCGFRISLSMNMCISFALQSHRSNNLNFLFSCIFFVVFSLPLSLTTGKNVQTLPSYVQNHHFISYAVM